MTDTQMALPVTPELAGQSLPDKASCATAGLSRWSSHALLAGKREAVIEHHGVEYRLRLTGQGKLILTK
ncbi:MAG TPA: hemin uptake protein HemP [Methylophilaceae bacterium]|nr:hemin uptake protein HemP [Methylophilaceae bacterium]